MSKGILKYFLPILGVIVVIAFFVFTSKTAGNKLPQKQRQLTEEQKKVYEDKIEKNREYLRTFVISDEFKAIEAANVNIFIAQQYYGLGELQKAKEAYEEALRVYPNFEQALVGLSLVYGEAEKYEDAKSVLRQALDKNIGSPELWTRYIDSFKVKDYNFEEIKNLYEQALEKTQRNIDVLTQAAVFYEQQKDFKKAIEFWEEAGEKNPAGKELYKREIERLGGSKQ